MSTLDLIWIGAVLFVVFWSVVEYWAWKTRRRLITYHMRRAPKMIVFILGLIIGMIAAHFWWVPTAEAAERDLRFAPDAIVIQEVYRKCRIVSALQLVDPQKDPKLYADLWKFKRSVKGVSLPIAASAVREWLIDTYPDRTTVVKMQFGLCGSSS